MNRLNESLRSRRQRGFTLIELFIALLMLQILTTVVIFAVGGIRDRGVVASADPDTPAPILALNDDMVRAANSLVDPNDPASTQSLVMALAVGAANADPATGQLDPAALNALYRNILDRERVLTDLIARTDELLAISRRHKDQQFLALSRNGLVQMLDGLRKIKVVIQSRAGG